MERNVRGFSFNYAVRFPLTFILVDMSIGLDNYLEFSFISDRIGNTNVFSKTNFVLMYVSVPLITHSKKII